MEYLNQFEIIDTLEKAYVLGLIQADGTIFYNEKAYSKCTKIKLKEEDKYLLDKIQELFPFFCTPKLEISKTGFKSYYIYSYSRKLYDDLLKNGIFPKKSFENALKSFMPELSKELFFSYILGLFDGDGTINKSKTNHIRIDLYGKNINLFNHIAKILQCYNIHCIVYYVKKRDLHMIRISEKQSVKLLIEYFSKCPICLNRKFKKYFNIDWSTIPGYDTRAIAIKKAKENKRQALVKQDELLES